MAIIRIYVYGEKIVQTDTDLNKIEPFIYNGTTYLPVRAVSQALGKKVIWDEKANSVYIGERLSENQETKADGTEWKIYINPNTGNVFRQTALEVKKQNDGSYLRALCYNGSVDVDYDIGGYVIYLFPVGVEVVSYGEVINSDISRVRLYAGRTAAITQTI